MRPTAMASQTAIKISAFNANAIRSPTEMRYPSSLNRQITWISRPSSAGPSIRYRMPRMSSDNFF
jgi:hypothetical protein